LQLIEVATWVVVLDFSEFRVLSPELLSCWWHTTLAPFKQQIQLVKQKLKKQRIYEND